MELTRIDNGKPGKLAGAWLMSGRIRNGQMQERNTSRPRKTMKILSGTALSMDCVQHQHETIYGNRRRYVHDCGWQVHGEH